jgi:hypothetical protein
MQHRNGVAVFPTKCNTNPHHGCISVNLLQHKKMNIATQTLCSNIVDGLYSYQTSLGLAGGEVLRRSQGTLLPSSVNPRYRICGTNVRCKILSIKAENTSIF